MLGLEEFKAQLKQKLKRKTSLLWVKNWNFEVSKKKIN